MAIAPLQAASGKIATADPGHINAPELRLFVMALFFIFGGITSLDDVIITSQGSAKTIAHDVI